MHSQVIAHMMPDLPNVGWERDLESFREFFENPAFRTDGLKIYPTLVIRGTGLYELWKAGLYRNYDPNLLVELVSSAASSPLCKLHPDSPVPYTTMEELLWAFLSILWLFCIP